MRSFLLFETGSAKWLCLRDGNMLFVSSQDYATIFRTSIPTIVLAHNLKHCEDTLVEHPRTTDNYNDWDFMWAKDTDTGDSCVVYVERATRKSVEFKCNESVLYIDYRGE